MTIYLPVLPSHCTRTRLTVVMSWSDELAVHSCLLLCLQRQVAKLASRLFYWWSSLRNNSMATNLQVFTWTYGRRFAACDCWKQTYLAGSGGFRVGGARGKTKKGALWWCHYTQPTV